MGIVKISLPRYRITLSEDYACIDTVFPFIGHIDKYNGAINKWDLVYYEEFRFKFIAWIHLNRILKKLKKADKIKIKYNIFEHSKANELKPVENTTPTSTNNKTK